MGSYTSPSGGGGGAIYEDGTPVTETLASSESVTVPTGETWVLFPTNTDRGRILVNGTRAMGGGDGATVHSNRLIVTEGDTIQEDTGGQWVLSGWSV